MVASAIRHSAFPSAWNNSAKNEATSNPPKHRYTAPEFECKNNADFNAQEDWALLFSDY